MTLYDLKTKEEWEGIVERFAKESNMTACLTDEKGNHMFCRLDRFPLCKTIREDKDALTFICSQTNTAMVAVVEKTLQPEIDMCDAGLFRVVVPIVRDNALVGLISACGLASDDEDEEVNDFLIAKELNVSEESIAELAKDTPIGSEDELEQIAHALFNELNEESSADESALAN